MTGRPLVSSITGTRQRHGLLLEMIDNIRAQTYRPLEMVIVSDGPDPELREIIAREQARGDVPIIFQELGFWASGFFQASLSAPPFLMAQLLATGPLHIWSADDNRFSADHVESLVSLLEATDSDFVYSRARVWSVKTHPGDYEEIGTAPPAQGQVTNVLYRRELLDYAMFDLHVGSGTDWWQVRKWMEAGARWAMLDRVTMSHRRDKSGEGPDYRSQRQILRGHYARA